MDDVPQQRVSRWRIARRCAPFAIVLLCFGLPFFTASSCGSGRETTATGVQIVTGSRLIAVQTQQPLGGEHVRLGPIGPDAEAQAVSAAAQPWAITLLIVAVVGTGSMLAARRRWRLVSIAMSLAAFAALVGLWSALDPSTQDQVIDPDGGLLLATLVLLLTVAWHACALVILAVRSALNPRRNPEFDPAEGGT